MWCVTSVDISLLEFFVQAHLEEGHASITSPVSEQAGDLRAFQTGCSLLIFFPITACFPVLQEQDLLS